MNKMYALVVVAPMVMASAASAQVLNGSFENNTAAAAQSNMNNGAYTATVSDSTAFGAASEVDLWDGSGFGMMVPYAGNWMIGMHNQGNTGNADAVSLTLASPLVVGQSYTVSFAAALFSFDMGGTIDVGTSGSATSLGNYLISATPASDSSWTLFSYSFTATSADSYLTFTVSNAGGYAMLDDVSLTPTPGAAAIFGLAGLAGMRRRRA